MRDERKLRVTTAQSAPGEERSRTVTRKLLKKVKAEGKTAKSLCIKDREAKLVWYSGEISIWGAGEGSSSCAEWDLNVG